MLKIKLLALGVLALFAIGVMSASSASAVFTLSEEKCGAGKFGLCWDSTNEGTNLRELKGEESSEIEQIGKGLVEVKDKVGGTTVVHWECGKAKAIESLVLQTEPLVKETIFTAKALLFSECAIVTPKTCTTPTELETKPITGEAVSQTVPGEGVKVKPTTGEIFVEVNFKGEECIVKGNQPVKGTQICLGLTVEVDLKGQELLCEHSESSLKLANLPASMEAEFKVTLPTLEKDDFWDLALV